MASNRTIRDEIKEVIRSSTFTIKLPSAGKIFTDDNGNPRHPSIQWIEDVRAKIAKVMHIPLPPSHGAETYRGVNLGDCSLS